MTVPNSGVAYHRVVRAVFLGSPVFALPSLEALLSLPGVEVVAVVTQPDRPAGRGHGTTAPPVKLAALERGLTVLQPENVSAPQSLEALGALAPDVAVVAAYGQILRQRFLDLPARGCVNVHASLLPRHRGASPVAASILAGDAVTGVTLMEVVRALDAGAMIARVEEPILDTDTTGTLEMRLAAAGGRVLRESLLPWYEGTLAAVPQDEALVTYAPQLRREDARLDWSLPAVDLWRRVRAFNPWPVAFTAWQGEELRVLEASPLAGDGAPGKVVSIAADGPVVQCGTGRLTLLRVQRAGRKAQSGAEFARGARGFEGAALG
jgi:methionyl-tRNA formyltransferase